MAGNRHSGGSPADEITAWMKRRTADVARLGHEAEAAGREAWSRATRAGDALAAARPADVVALGVRVLQQARSSGGPSSAGQSASNARQGTHTTPPQRMLRSADARVREQVLAGARGAQDAFTFGMGDRAYAGGRALLDAAHGTDLRDAYHQRMEVERARDRYDDAHFKAARTVGQIAGTGAQLAVLGPAEGLLAGGARIAETAPLLLREGAALVGSGAVLGGGGQIVSDAIAGRRSSLGDIAGAAVGGGSAALMSRYGSATLAGATDGSITSAAQDMFNGRPISGHDALRGASAGGVLGGVGGIVGRRWSDSLSNRQKEAIGESLSRARTFARGDSTEVARKSREYLPGGGYTYPDQRTYRVGGVGELVESKFGRSNDLRPRQRQASRELDNYRVDHWLPQDVGTIAGFPLAATGSYLTRE